MAVSAHATNYTDIIELTHVADPSHPGDYVNQLKVTDLRFSTVYTEQNEEGWWFRWYISIDGGLILTGPSPQFHTTSTQDISVVLHLSFRAKRDGDLPPDASAPSFVIEQTFQSVQLAAECAHNNTSNDPILPGRHIELSKSISNLRCGDSVIFYLTTICPDSLQRDITFSYNDQELAYVNSYFPNNTNGISAITGIPLGTGNAALNITLPNGSVGPQVIALCFESVETSLEECPSETTIEFNQAAGTCSDNVLRTELINEFRSPFDPNAKIPQPSYILLENLINAGSIEVTFTICFQNTGDGPTDEILIIDNLPQYMTLTDVASISSSFDDRSTEVDINIDAIEGGSSLQWKLTSKPDGDFSLNGIQQFGEEPTSEEVESTIGWIQFKVIIDYEVLITVMNIEKCACLSNTAEITFEGAEPMEVTGSIVLSTDKNICKEEYCGNFSFYQIQDNWWPYEYSAIEPKRQPEPKIKK